MNACSCLTLILACIVYWQARELSRIAAAPNFPFDPRLIARVSPIEWKNGILAGYQPGECVLPAPASERGGFGTHARD